MAQEAEKPPITEGLSTMSEVLSNLQPRFDAPLPDDPENLFGNLGLVFQLVIAGRKTIDSGLVGRMEQFCQTYVDVHSASLSEHGVSDEEVTQKSIDTAAIANAKALVADVVKALQL